MRRSSFWAKSAGEWVTKPVWSWLTISLGPILSVTMTGILEAMASRTTLPKVSAVEGKTKMSAEA